MNQTLVIWRKKGGRFFEILWPFNNIWTLKKHIERRHGIVPDTHPEAVCRYCHEEFIDKESNTRHPCPVRMKANETLKVKVAIFSHFASTLKQPLDKWLSSMSFWLLNSHQNPIRILKQCLVDFFLELSYLGIVVLSL